MDRRKNELEHAIKRYEEALQQPKKAGAILNVTESLGFNYDNFRPLGGITAIVWPSFFSPFIPDEQREFEFAPLPIIGDAVRDSDIMRLPTEPGQLYLWPAQIKSGVAQLDAEDVDEVTLEPLSLDAANLQRPAVLLLVRVHADQFSFGKLSRVMMIAYAEPGPRKTLLQGETWLNLLYASRDNVDFATPSRTVLNPRGANPYSRWHVGSKLSAWSAVGTFELNARRKAHASLRMIDDPTLLLAIVEFGHESRILAIDDIQQHDPRATFPPEPTAADSVNNIRVFILDGILSLIIRDMPRMLMLLHYIDLIAQR